MKYYLYLERLNKLMLICYRSDIKGIYSDFIEYMLSENSSKGDRYGNCNGCVTHYAGIFHSF